MAELSLNTDLRFKTTNCITCGCVIVLEEHQYAQRLKDRENYYCPNGHNQHFIAETEESKLRRQVADLQTREATAKREADYQRKRAEEEAAGKVKAQQRLKRLTKSGLCPCCRRNFTNVKRHIETKHPKWEPTE